MRFRWSAVFSLVVIFIVVSMSPGLTETVSFPANDISSIQLNVDDLSSYTNSTINFLEPVDLETINFNDGSSQSTAYRSVITLPVTKIPAGDTAVQRLTVPTNKTMNIIRLGIQTKMGNSPVDAHVEVDNDNDPSSVITSTSSVSATSSATLSSESLVVIRADNDSASDTKSLSVFVEANYE
jgi:hypothetical protein